MRSGRGEGQKERLLGALMLAHFVVVCCIKAVRSVPEDIAWISHISLFMAGAALIWQNRLLRASALTNVLIIHAVWVVDCVVGLASGRFPVGVSNYMGTANTWVWLATVHHFYLLPVLLALQIRDRSYPMAAPVLSAAVFCALTLVSRLALSEQANVNYAFVTRFQPRHPVIIWANSLAPASYLAVLNAFVSVGIFLPTAVLLSRFAGRPLGAARRAARRRPEPGPFEHDRRQRRASRPARLTRLNVRLKLPRSL